MDADSQRENAGPDGREDSGFVLRNEVPPPPRGPFVGVVVNRPIEQVLTYRVPERLAGAILPGQRVRVPLGRGDRMATGYCVRVDESPPPDLGPVKLKDVAEILDAVPLIDARMLELTRWIAEYYVCSWGQALDAAVPAGVRNQAGTRVGTFLLVPEDVRQSLLDEAARPRLSPKQAAALEVLCRAEEPLSLADVCRLALRHRPGAGPAAPGIGAFGPSPARFPIRAGRRQARVDGDARARGEVRRGFGCRTLGRWRP